MRGLRRFARLAPAAAAWMLLGGATGPACKRPATPPTPPAGELAIQVEPPGPGINVVIDGDLAFELPADGRLSVRLPPAAHRVQIDRDGYYSVWRIVEVPPPPRPAVLEITLHEVRE